MNSGLIQTLELNIKQKFDLEKVVYYAKIPVDKHRTKKNSRPIFTNRKTGKSFLGKDKSLASAENSMVSVLRAQRARYGIDEPIKFDVWILFLFWFDSYYTKKGYRAKTLGDLSNLYQLPEDCLQKAGVIENDSQICSHDLSRRLPGKENCLEIFVFKYED